MNHDRLDICTNSPPHASASPRACRNWQGLLYNRDIGSRHISGCASSKAVSRSDMQLSAVNAWQSWIAWSCGQLQAYKVCRSHLMALLPVGLTCLVTVHCMRSQALLVWLTKCEKCSLAAAYIRTSLQVRSEHHRSLPYALLFGS